VGFDPGFLDLFENVGSVWFFGDTL